MTKYSRGRSFEYQVARYLESLGYVVVRSAGSKGPADLVAVRPGEVLFVACSIGGVKKPSRDALLEACRRAGATPVLARRDRGVVLEIADALHKDLV